MVKHATIRELLDFACQEFKANSIANGRLDARLLLGHVLQKPVEYLLAFPELEVSQPRQEAFRVLLDRRLQAEPVSRILGAREFWGLEFLLSPDTLDPRPDSETLVESVLKFINDRQQPLSILDLGTGTGCLLLSVLSELPYASGTGIDISAAALETAKKNAVRHQLEERTRFFCNNWLDNVAETFDWIITNPPYISLAEIDTLDKEVRFYDPLKALAGGVDGLECYRILAAQIPVVLKPQGKIALEVGQKQEMDVEKIFMDHGFECLEWAMDLQGIKRCGIFRLR